MEDLVALQAHPLKRKVSITQAKILEWYTRWDDDVYVSFSGGKDSTVLADLTARAHSGLLKPSPLTLVFIDTGLEYPEVRDFVPHFKEWLESTYQIHVL